MNFLHKVFDWEIDLTSLLNVAGKKGLCYTMKLIERIKRSPVEKTRKENEYGYFI